MSAVKATIDCCTVDDVLRSPFYEERRAAVSITDPHIDEREFLQEAIAAFSYQAEQETGRWFRAATYTEVLDADCGQRVLQLRAYPVTSITSIKEAWDGDFASVTALDTDAYALVKGGRFGQVKLRSREFYAGVQSIQVVYVGGLAPAVHQLPADLRLAAVEQVPYMVERAKTAHLKAESGPQGGSATFFRDTPLLGSVAHTLGRYRTPA